MTKPYHDLKFANTIVSFFLWVSGRALDSGKAGFESLARHFFFATCESPGPSFSGVQASRTVKFLFLFLRFFVWVLVLRPFSAVSHLTYGATSDVCFAFLLIM